MQLAAGHGAPIVTLQAYVATELAELGVLDVDICAYVKGTLEGGVDRDALDTLMEILPSVSTKPIRRDHVKAFLDRVPHH